ncbi:hypothetical protein FCULG_00005383 [Fusarium culmorum]|uniref:Uncharacterized protein n=1 Tax=Fusarium culmorum TaxID=5516 RepID=A0A2T4GXX2_FUSCU|nr:hypothetical protein FCULG_00005383 [Fusarium culmorum]
MSTKSDECNEYLARVTRPPGKNPIFIEDKAILAIDRMPGSDAKWENPIQHEMHCLTCQQ